VAPESSDDLIGRYVLKRLPTARLSSIDVCEVGRRKHYVQAFLEVDVTDARRAIHAYRARTGNKLSFTAWFIKCAAQAVSEHSQAHAVRRGRRGVLVFEDTDFTVLVERTLGTERVPMPIVVRRANSKSLSEIHDEIRSAQEQPLAADDLVLKRPQHRFLYGLAFVLPAFVRRIFWDRVIRDPFAMKRMMGTIAVTSVGMFGRAQGWVVPISIFPLCFGLGTVAKKPGVVRDRVEVREFLSLTAMVDHDVIDGAPAARFISRLVQLMENGSGLDRLDAAQAGVRQHESAPDSTA
jgi:hypothetical protein